MYIYYKTFIYPRKLFNHNYCIYYYRNEINACNIDKEEN